MSADRGRDPRLLLSPTVLLYELMMQRSGAAPLPFDEHEPVAFDEALRCFRWGQASTVVSDLEVTTDAGSQITVRAFTNEFWTARQRAAHSLHEISYRACFKPQLPRFFIDRLTVPGDIVYDPFMGRGTTLIEAALMGRRPYGCDVRSEERRVGKECSKQCRSRWSPYH